ncbi:MAG: hypothetical protein GY898_13545 [Proteobacteria bacterium]|nr:hypothetical protein [Pseudomonadota bacterium]
MLLGLVGTALMVAMLVYTLRKVLVRARWLGPTSAWLHFHIVCGVGGPLCILLHSGLLVWPRGLIAVGFWCMVAVALSGGFGRYVYGLLPRASGGRELCWDAAQARLADLREVLVLGSPAEIDTAAEEKLRLERALKISGLARRLFRYWHLFHRPIAGAMYVIVALHVASAVLFGGSLAQLAQL